MLVEIDASPLPRRTLWHRLVVGNLRRLDMLVDVVDAFGAPTTARLYATRVLGHRRGVDVRYKGMPLRLRTATPDYRVALSSLGSEFEPLRHALEPEFDGLIVDAGGYIGTAAIKFAQMFPRALVVTIEASAENFRVLEHNVRAYPGIVALHRALHHESGATVSLQRGGDNAEWGFSIVEEDGRETFETVPAITIAEVFAEFGKGREIGIVKLDVEGAEAELLRRCGSDFDRARVVVAELHDEWVPGCRAAFDAFSRGRIVITPSGEKLVSVRPVGARA